MSLTTFLFHGGAALTAVLMTAITMFPIAYFLRHGWERKKQEILRSFFDGDAITAYLRRFINFQAASPKAASDAFERVYQERYGKGQFTWPVLMLLLACLGLSYLMTATALSHLMLNGAQIIRAPAKSQVTGLVTLPNVAVAAAIGGYLWVTWDQINTLRRSDFQRSYLLAGALRLIASVPVGYAVGSISNTGAMPFVAFAAAAFPLDGVRLILRQLTVTRLNLTNTPAAVDQLRSLDGVDSNTADALNEVGLTTIPQLAYFDPVRLAITTGYSFQFIVDLVGQALAWLYFRDALPTIAKAGLRSAVEIHSILEDANKTGPRGLPLPDATMAATQAQTAATTTDNARLKAEAARQAAADAQRAANAAGSELEQAKIGVAQTKAKADQAAAALRANQDPTKTVALQTDADQSERTRDEAEQKLQSTSQDSIQKENAATMAEQALTSAEAAADMTAAAEKDAFSVWRLAVAAERANAALDTGAKAVDVPPAVFRATCDQIAHDPYTEFLVKVWH